MATDKPCDVHRRIIEYFRGHHPRAWSFAHFFKENKGHKNGGQVQDKYVKNLKDIGQPCGRNCFSGEEVCRANELLEAYYTKVSLITSAVGSAATQ
jgi:hypothetical protein